MRLIRWRSELIVAGRNALLRRLLCHESDIPHAKPSSVREGPPQSPQAPSRSPSLIEVAYSSAFEVKPDLFVPGIGMEIPARVGSWLAEEPRRPA